MRKRHFFTVVHGLAALILLTIPAGSATAADALTDSLTLSSEVHLNERQPPDTVLKAIGLKPGMIIGEVGAGRGRYTVQMAARIGPAGHIYANDILPDVLQYLDDRCKKHDLTNVTTVLGTVTDSRLPDSSLDMVIMVNVLHHLDKPVELLRNLETTLKPSGFIAIVDGNRDKDSTATEWFTREKLIGICEDAGYTVMREETFLPKDNIYLLAVERPQE